MARGAARESSRRGARRAAKWGASVAALRPSRGRQGVLQVLEELAALVGARILRILHLLQQVCDMWAHPRRETGYTTIRY